MAEGPELDVRMVLPGAEPAASLIAAMVAEMRALYHDLDINKADLPSAAPEDFDRFLVGEEPAGIAVCCGGLKPLGGDAAEIKRMYREAGYAEIGNFNANPIAGCFWGEKRLSDDR